MGSSDDALEQLVAFAESRPDAAVVGPRLAEPGRLAAALRARLPHAVAARTEYFFLRKLAPRTQALNAFYARRLRPRRACARPSSSWARSCSSGARRSSRSGPLDEDFFLFSEETDWCYRFQQAGWKVLFFPGAEFVHVGGASHGGRMFTENLRGHLRFLAKHRGAGRGRAGEAAAARLAAAARGDVPRRAGPDVPRGGGWLASGSAESLLTRRARELGSASA